MVHDDIKAANDRKGSIPMHEHSHTHEHLNGHTHEHAHAREHEHVHGDHEHVHKNTHAHDNGGQSSDMKEIHALVRYMLSHNRHHAAELRGLGEKLDAAGDHETASLIENAVSCFEKGNLELEKAVRLLD
jgi:2-methylaconitate cis-trans-isomerase PrpF